MQPQKTRAVHSTPPNERDEEKSRKETDIALDAKREYAALGPSRSFAKLVDRMKEKYPGHYRGKSETLARRFKNWSDLFNWRGYVNAFDREEDEKRREEDREREIEARGEAESRLALMNSTQAQLAEALHMKTLGRISDLLDIDQALVNQIKALQNGVATGALPLDTEIPRPRLYVTGTVLAQLWREAVDVHRLAAGAATEIAVSKHDGGIRVNVVTARKAEIDPDVGEDGDDGEYVVPFGRKPLDEGASDESAARLLDSNREGGAGHASKRKGRRDELRRNAAREGDSDDDRDDDPEDEE